VHEFIGKLIEISALIINLMALVVVWIGTIEAFIKAIPAVFQPPSAERLFQPVWSRFARWLVAGLTFQLAADIIETSLKPSWEDIGRLAAIAVVRTFLNYFLARDLADMTARRKDGAISQAPG
jgi:uncharacterized membrane protein